MANWLVLSGMVDFNCQMCGSCCSEGWNIYLSKDEYIKLEEIAGENILNEATEVLPEGLNEAGFAKISNKNNKCLFMEHDNLCKIHRDYGFAYLPHVCTIFPRRIFITPRGIEVSVIFSCPETMKLLLSREKIRIIENPPGFLFDVSHLSLPTITEELINSKGETRWYFRLEEAFMNILQDRVLTLEMRMAITGLLIYYFNRYSDDETRQKEFPEMLRNHRRLAKQARSLETNLDHQLQVLTNFLHFRTGLHTSDDFRQIVETVFAGLGLVPGKPVTKNSIELYKADLSQLYNEREIGYITANYLVCNVFSKLLYIFGLEGGFHGLSFLYALIRFIAVGLAKSADVPVNQDILIKAISTVDYNVRHSAEFMDHILLAQGIQKYEPEYFAVERSLALVLANGK